MKEKIVKNVYKFRARRIQDGGTRKFVYTNQGLAVQDV